jgi:hypothetical protein
MAFFAVAKNGLRQWLLKFPEAHFGDSIKHVVNFTEQVVEPYGGCQAYTSSKFNSYPIIQQVVDPHLIGGRMYDLRAYLLVRAPTDATPAEAYHLWGSAFVRRCTTDYADRVVGKLAKHATVCNIHQAKQHPALNEVLLGTNVSTQTIAALFRFLELSRPGVDLLTHYPAIHKRVDKKLATLASAMAHRIRTAQTQPRAPLEDHLSLGNHNWHLAAVDMIVDRWHTPWVIEVNLDCLGSCKTSCHEEGNYVLPWSAAVRVAQSRFLQITAALGNASHPYAMEPCLVDCKATRLKLSTPDD